VTFDEVLARVLELLQRETRVSYRALKRRFDLDDAYLEDLKAEIVDAKRLAADEDGKVLVWTGAVASAPPPPLAPARAQERAPLSYTPQHLADKILTFRSALAGERKQVTVLFCDLANSTALAERIGPEAMHALLNRFFELALDGVHRYEGTINQFLGDGFMALFGAPIAHEDHARRAVLAAVTLQRSLQAHHAELGEPHGVACQFRLGLNTGLVVVGSIGDNLRMDYTAIGDTTNLAARVQQTATPGAIQLTEQTYRLVAGYFDCENLGLVQVKGKADQVRVYRVTGERDARSRIDVAREHGFTRFVGRERELELLRESYERARAGRGQAISIMGEAGVGKSRLLYEFRQALSYEDLTFLEGRCSPYGATVAYLPIIELLKQILRIDTNDSSVDTTHKVEHGLQRLGVDLETTAPYVLHLLAVDPGGGLPADLPPDVFKRRTFEALQMIMLTGAAQRPLVIAIEDLHWADPTTAEFATFLLGQVAASPILFACTYRPEFVSTWPRKSYHSAITLTRLSPRDGRQLLAALLGTTRIQDELVELVVEKSEGVPFFLEELVRSLRETGAMALHEGQWTLTPAATALQVPATVHDVLMARIDRLPEGAKRVLQIGAVIGREFSWELINAVAALPEQELRTQLAALTDAELLYERGLPPEATYVFKHALTQDVAYDSLLTPRKQALHGAIGGAIEVLCPERLEEQCELLAHHFARSVQADKAVHYLLLAGKKAEEMLFVHAQAIAFLEDALGCFARLPDREAWKRKEVETLFELEMAYDNLAKRDDQRRILERLVHTAQALDDPVILSDAYIRYGAFLSLAGAAQEALTYAERALSLKQLVGDKREEVKALGALGFIFWQLGRYEEALQTHRAILQVHRDLGDQGAQGLELTNLGELLRQLRRYQEALHCLEEAVQLLSAILDPFELSPCYNSLGNVYRDLGEYETALQYHHKSREHILRIGPLKESASTMISCANIAAIHSQLGNHREALQYYREALEMSRRLGDRPEMVATLRCLAVTHEILGEFPDALACYQEALPLSRDLGDRQEERGILLRLGDLYRQQLRDFPAALTCYRQGLAIAGKVGEDAVRLALLKGLGVTCWNLEHYEDAATAFEQALVLVEAAGDRAEQAVIRSSLGVVSLALRRYATALAHLQAGLAIAQALADPRAEGYILNALGNVYYEIGDQRLAMDCYQQSVQLRQRLLDRKGEGWSLYYLGRAQAEAGELDAACRHQEQALHLAAETGDAELQARTRIALSALQRCLEDHEACGTALRYAQEAVELAQAHGLRQEESAGLSHQAMALLLLGQAEEARVCSEAAVHLLETGGRSDSDRERIWLHHARILRACGQKEPADGYLERAYTGAMERLAAVRDARLREAMLHAGLLREILAERRKGG
jgi:predicted ATPase/class 3 adenylate cyclase